ncbi:Flp pilus assembly protein CpaB [Kiritimatiellota bacterium B12222]|nr:Flp pilus assembly protein CpaB [Kiritimatiellota bacterium B12222]
MKQKIVLIIALGMGALAFVLTYTYLKSERDAIYKDATMVTVLVAREDLPQGTQLKPHHLREQDVFETGLSPKVFRKDDERHVLGKTLVYSMKKGETLDWLRIGANLDELSGLAPTIISGMRAISIPVSNESAVSGLVRPNDKVDILGTFSFMDEDRPGEMKTVTFTVLQDVTVLATGQETARAELQITSNSRRRNSYNTITISVFPEEAELLAFAVSTKGSLTLSLRNPQDVSVMDQTPPIDFQTLQQELPRLNSKRQQILRGQENTQILSR